MHLPIFKPALLSVLVSASLMGCNSDSSSSNKPSLVTLAPQDIHINQTKQWIGLPLDIIDQNFNLTSLELLIFENNQPVKATAQGQYLLSHGIVDVDLSASRITYIPMTDAEQRSFNYRLADSRSQKDGSIIIDGHFLSDPLSHEQWHLHNTGQTGFAMQPQTYEAWQELRIAQGWTKEDAEQVFQFDPTILVPGQDMNVLGAYKHNITGKDAIVVVVDSGLAIDHEDLKENVLPNRSLNFTNFTYDPTLAGLGGDHGTSVAGLIAAQGWNGLGGRGVAPDAKLIGMNYLAEQNDQTAAASHGMAGSGISPDENVVAFNRSYGFSAPAFIATSPIDEVLVRYPTNELRSGKGALNIKSSGNSFISLPGWAEAVELCDLAQQGLVTSQQSRTLSCADSNWDPHNASFYSVTVGAVNSDGKKSSYSTAGSSLWVAAPAGEYGTTEPAMVTTDQMSCQRGYSSQADVDGFESDLSDFFAALGVENFYHRVWPFNAPGTELNQAHNPECNYTNTFNGTSSAAPNVSGVVALIAEANPNLNWREIRHILAHSADKVDPNDKPIVLHVGGQQASEDASNGLATFTAHLGWVENAAGYAFNNKYGFGRVNAGKAVELAKSGSVQLPPLVETDWLTFTPEQPMLIPDADAQGIQFSFTIDASVVAEPLVVEGLQFGFNITNADLLKAIPRPVRGAELTGTTAASDLAIKVTSPAGTESILATSRSSLGAFNGYATTAENGYAYHVDSPILTNAFYGEKVYGQWKVTIVDTNGADLDRFINNQQDSELTKAQMRIFGHVANPAL